MFAHGKETNSLVNSSAADTGRLFGWRGPTGIITWCSRSDKQEMLAPDSIYSQLNVVYT